jgi:3-mercaptopyruvate sulfurtransferase SseA
MNNFNRCKAVLMIWIMILLIACASGPLTSKRPPKACEPTDNIPRITAEELKKLMDEGADLVVVDTLYPYWYKRGHIKGAINFPWAESIKEPITLPRTKLVVLYCDCECEETSADVAIQLVRDWGYKNIRVLKGGWAEWNKLGYPTEKGEEKR